ncbi:MAG: aminodeoxychorismate synthase component I [Opitutae bacterium]|nr:aminodeoxychorismate synthase component I [Opitutae bacterium]
MLLRETSSRLSPVEIFSRLARRRGCFFLDSARTGDGLGRWAFLGFEPFLTLEATGANITLTAADGTSEMRHGDPLEVLRELLHRYRPADTAKTPVPFVGGAVGGFAYEFGTRFERRTAHTGPDDLGLPDLRFGFYDGFLAFDHDSGKTWIAANPVNADDAESILARLDQALREALAAPAPVTTETSTPAEPQAEFPKADYLRAVTRIQDYIGAGDVYQVNLTQRFATPQPAPAPELYLRLRERSPAAFSCYFDFGRWQVVGSSPERFLRLRDGHVITRPIKGTRPRGRTAAEDARLRAELLASEKDRAELLMIVDLERNDLGRVCEFGSVRVDNLHHLEEHPTVFHLVADVSGRLCAGADVFDCLRAAFPGGSITGAPKIRAMQIIAELEPHRRHFYTGSFGYLGFDGSAELNIAIRTLFCTGGRAYYHVGGGIVADSDPEAEYQETLDKGRAMRAALLGEITSPSPARRQVMLNGRLLAEDDPRVAPLGDGPPDGRGVFETIKLVRGQPVFFAEHCARLAHGIRALGLVHAPAPAELRARCAAVIAANPAADGVLKIVVFAYTGGASELILTGESRYTAADYERGFNVLTVRGAAYAPPLAGLKALDRAACQKARSDARGAGCDEALFISPSGEALEGTVSNLFVVRAGRVCTPPLDSGILPGIVRARMLATGAPPVEEVAISEQMLRDADEVFLTNSLLGVMPVAHLDGRALNLQRNPVTRAFMAGYRDAENVSLHP